MTREQEWYCLLKCKGGNSYHENGTTIKSAERIINIGESADCDIRYESDGFQPEYFASIVKNDDGKSWRIVKRSPYIDIGIVGKGIIGYAYQLADGDHIQFGDKSMTLCFHIIRNDENQNRQMRWQWLLAAMVCLLGFLIAAIVLDNHNDINERDVISLEESLYLIKVDSVQQVILAQGLENSIKRRKILTNDIPTGTAFLTTDGRLVTARHCVEYWLGRNLDLTTKVASMSDDDIVKWAIETETFNQNHSVDTGSSMQLKVYFSIYNFLGEKKMSFVSTDRRVHINRERDGLFLLADFSQDYYWRSIRPYFNDKEMMMGDIVWIDGIAERGKVQLGTTSEMKNIRRGTKLMICGYPITGTNDWQVVFVAGSIKRDAATDTENLFFESNINHGFSGGPVLIKSGGSVFAVGVVSRVDSTSSGLFKWAVPVTEIAIKKGGNADE